MGRQRNERDRNGLLANSGLMMDLGTVLGQKAWSDGASDDSKK